MKKLFNLSAALCLMVLSLFMSSFTTVSNDEPTLEGTWVEVFYEFNFDGGKVESKTYKFDAMLSNQEKWYFTAKGENQYNLKVTYFHRNSGGFIEDGDWDITVKDNAYATEFTDNFKITKLTEDELVIECYNGTTLKERKSFKKKVE